jgi:N-acetylmuramoyl-L-alanine amidase
MMRALSLLLLIFTLSRPSFSQIRIVLDPGHGGSDLGAVRDSFVESKLTLEIAKKLKEELRRRSAEEVYLTREADVTVALKERSDFANKNNADIFISLHANTSNSSQISGMEFYFNSSAKKSPITLHAAITNAEVLEQIKQDFKIYEKTRKSLLLSKNIKAKTELAVEKSVIKRAPFYVIENTEMPSILIELGFLSNRREAKKLSSDEYQSTIASLIADALIEWHKNESLKL